MNEISFLDGKVVKRSLRIFEGAPPAGTIGPKRLILPQGELANFYDEPEGIRYLAYIELRQDSIRGNHLHRVKEEQVYIIQGEALLVIQEPSSGKKESINLSPGDLVKISTGIAHALKAVQRGHGIEFSTAQFDPTDIERVKLI